MADEQETTGATRGQRMTGIPSRMNSSMSRIPSTAILGRLARKDRFANQMFGRWREVFCLQVSLGKEIVCCTEGRAYRAQEHLPNRWHGYPVGWGEVPPKLVRHGCGMET